MKLKKALLLLKEQEIYSIMRHDDSDNNDYLDYFYDTGSERTTNFEPK